MLSPETEAEWMRAACAVIGPSASLALALVALIIGSDIGSLVAATLLVISSMAYLVAAIKGLDVQHRPRRRRRQPWSTRAVWMLVVISIFLLAIDSAVADRWPAALVCVGIGIIALTEGFDVWRQSSHSLSGPGMDDISDRDARRVVAGAPNVIEAVDAIRAHYPSLTLGEAVQLAERVSGTRRTSR
ncbi:hypothetical protein LQL77_30470 [Rhodococcus cerastii]|nr:hypothetical protein [Rhodococcus cerastii]